MRRCSADFLSCVLRAIAYTRIRLFSVFVFTPSPIGTKRCATAHYRVKKLQQFAFTFCFTSCKRKVNASKKQHLQKPIQQTTTKTIERGKAISPVAIPPLLFMHKKISPFGEEVNIKVENHWTRPRELGVFAIGLAEEPWLRSAKKTKTHPLISAMSEDHREKPFYSSARATTCTTFAEREDEK